MVYFITYSCFTHKSVFSLKVCCLRSVTHVSKIWANFCLVFHANLLSFILSDSRFWHQFKRWHAPKLSCAWLKWWFMISHWLMWLLFTFHFLFIAVSC